MTAKLPAQTLWLENGLPITFLENLHLSEDPDPAVDSSFKLGTVAQAKSQTTCTVMTGISPVNPLLMSRHASVSPDSPQHIFTS